ncbi:DUF937 domain-containing protein [Runella sp. MFBS21]|uniref:DUF937 domain-containing protein n=1 Tax=Runella sp. MFBS21 TaxID=3034018 RepID=UPI0023F8CE64|nr:DUF937 domain-containing protein [Runella sp. MFBS21]MDF7817124.1 DUF937 domain-containing protein [Runella sp. MFBS21]
MNLFASLKEALTEGLISQIAQQHNVNSTKIQKAFDILQAAIVGGLIKRVTTESGMNYVFNQVKKIEFRPEELSKIVTNQAQLEALKNVGEKDLNTVLPGLKSSITGLVAKYAGIQNSLASSICGMAVGMVMTVLKKIVTEKQLDAESLAAFLGEQREPLLSIVPDINDKLIETVGIQYLLQNFTVPRNEQSGSVSKGGDTATPSQPFLVGVDVDQSSNNGSYLKWVGVGVLVIGVIAAAIYFWNQRQATPSEEDIEADTLSEARTIQEPLQDTLKKDTATALPAAPATTPTASNPMATYLADNVAPQGKAFKFENIDFENNTAQLKPTATASVAVLADLLKKYPNAQIKLVGYANDAQLPLTNKTLSVKRVLALKDQFVKAGISYIRVDAEGRGTGINPKDTTGRKQVAMREVWVKFVKK